MEVNLEEHYENAHAPLAVPWSAFGKFLERNLRAKYRRDLVKVETHLRPILHVLDDIGVLLEHLQSFVSAYVDGGDVAAWEGTGNRIPLKTDSTAIFIPYCPAQSRERREQLAEFVGSKVYVDNMFRLLHKLLSTLPSATALAYDEYSAFCDLLPRVFHNMKVNLHALLHFPPPYTQNAEEGSTERKDSENHSPTCPKHSKRESGPRDDSQQQRVREQYNYYASVIAVLQRLLAHKTTSKHMAQLKEELLMHAPQLQSICALRTEVMGQWNALQDGLRTLALLSRGGSCFADEELLSHERDGEAWLSKDSECNRGEWRTWVARDEDHEEGGMRGMHAWPPISVERLHRLQRALKDAEEKYQQQLCDSEIQLWIEMEEELARHASGFERILDPIIKATGMMKGAYGRTTCKVAWLEVEDVDAIEWLAALFANPSTIVADVPDDGTVGDEAITGITQRLFNALLALRRAAERVRLSIGAKNVSTQSLTNEQSALTLSKKQITSLLDVLALFTAQVEQDEVVVALRAWARAKSRLLSLEQRSSYMEKQRRFNALEAKRGRDSADRELNEYCERYRLALRTLRRVIGIAEDFHVTACRICLVEFGLHVIVVYDDGTKKLLQLGAFGE